MRIITKPSTAQCTFPTYLSFLLSEPKNATCTRLSDLLGISHDSINRFLQREDYTPKDLFDNIKSKIALEGGTLSVDDSVIDKLYSDPNKAELIDYFWSGKHKKTIKGVNLITLDYTDVNQVSVPVNFRIVDKSSKRSLDCSERRVRPTHRPFAHYFSMCKYNQCATTNNQPRFILKVLFVVEH